jgi:hypothetical protein
LPAIDAALLPSNGNLARRRAEMLARSSARLPIPGTSNFAPPKENLAAATISLSDEEFAALGAEPKWIVPPLPATAYATAALNSSEFPRCPNG